MGLTSAAIPRGMHAALVEGDGDDTDVLSTVGTVTTTERLAHFALRWRLVGRDPSVEEVLPFRPSCGGRPLPTPRHAAAGA